MSSPRTAVHWEYGEATVTVQMAEALTPEALESVLMRTRREFVAGCRQLGVAIVDDEPAEN